MPIRILFATIFILLIGYFISIAYIIIRKWHNKRCITKLFSKVYYLYPKLKEDITLDSFDARSFYYTHKIKSFFMINGYTTTSNYKNIVLVKFLKNILKEQKFLEVIKDVDKTDIGHLFYVGNDKSIRKAKDIERYKFYSKHIKDKKLMDILQKDFAKKSFVCPVIEIDKEKVDLEPSYKSDLEYIKQYIKEN